MSRNFLHRLESTVTGGAILIATASLVSRILGLFRERLLFSHFGAGDTLDSYYVAFRLPDFIFNILVLGALSSAFIPVFIETWHRQHDDEKEKAAWELSNVVLNIIMTGLLVFGVLAFTFAPQLVPLLAPGFKGQKLVETVYLTRIMLISIMFFGVSNIMSSILNSMRRFFAFAFAPVFYNIGIIFGITVLYPILGIAGLAWGVVCGSLLHLLIQLPTVFRMGYRYAFIFRLGTNVRKVFRLMLPRTLGLAAVQIDQTVSAMIGSTLASGSVAIFSGAYNLASLPISIFGISLAIASFPVFSEAFAMNDTPRFVTEFSKVFRRVLFFIIPVSVLMLFLRAHIVRVVLGSGLFNWNATILTAQSLGFFSLSLFAQSLTPTLTRSFYALHDTATPVKISFLSVALDIAGCVLLAPHFGVIGLALSFSFASMVQMLLLLVVLRVRLGNLDDRTILDSTIKIIVASTFMAGVVWLSLRFFAQGVNQHTFVGILLQGVSAGLVGLFVYIIVAMLFRFDEVSLIRQWLLRAHAQLFVNGKSADRP